MIERYAAQRAFELIMSETELDLEPAPLSGGNVR